MPRARVVARPRPHRRTAPRQAPHAGRVTDRDRKALTPLVWEHANPYGCQELDMRTRIAALT